MNIALNPNKVQHIPEKWSDFRETQRNLREVRATKKDKEGDHPMIREIRRRLIEGIEDFRDMGFLD
jgi:hypothetical protein